MANMDKRDIDSFRTNLKEQLAEDRIAIRAGLSDAVLAVGRADRERLRWIVKADRAELWREDGHKGPAQFVSATFHVSNWKARRWIEAAFALECLPLTAAALDSGALSLDKVVELTRFVTPADESRWIRWAAKTTPGGVRDRADAELKRTEQEAEEIQSARYLKWWKHDDLVYLEGALPLDQGGALTEAVDTLARELPAHPDDTAQRESLGLDDEPSIDNRRADALVLLATGGSASSEPVTVVVHAPIEALAEDDGGCTLEGGGVLHPETARRISCDARLQIVLEDKEGNAVGIGGISQITPYWLRRQVFYRDDNTCTFPGCEMKRFLHPHHVRHWSRKGPTDLDNLVTVCTTHHKLIHEGRWCVTLDVKQRAIWFRPSGRVYEPGPAPPIDIAAPKKDPPRLAEAMSYSKLLGLAAVI
jgi:hypothetical protein